MLMQMVPFVRPHDVSVSCIIAMNTEILVENLQSSCTNPNCTLRPSYGWP